MNMQTKTSNLWTPLRLGLLAGLIGMGVSLEASARAPSGLFDPRLTISNVTVSEPSIIGEAAEATLTVTLVRIQNFLPVFPQFTPPNPQPVSVDFKTVDGLATEEDLDYDAAQGTLSFEGQETTKTITVQVRGDNVVEGTENLIVELSNPQGAVLLDGQGQIDINNTPGTAGPDPDPDECPEGQVLHAGVCRPVHMQR